MTTPVLITTTATPPAKPKRGHCPECGNDYDLTVDGLLRLHGRFRTSAHKNPCPGSWQPARAAEVNKYFKLLDTEMLYFDLNRKRRQQGVSWRELARELGLPKNAVFVRLSQGKGISADALVVLLLWLGHDALIRYARLEPAD